MNTLPLLVADSLSAPLIYHRGQLIDVAHFAGAVQSLVEQLPTKAQAVNLCENRYYFLLGLVAACLRKQLTLLPPNQTPTVLNDLKADYPDQYVIDDTSVEHWLQVKQLDVATTLPHWRIDAQHVVALTFTSGSTGKPQPHTKTWQTLSRNAQLAAAEVLGGMGVGVVATVPAQHVYGLETSVISGLVAKAVIYDGKPFFPNDVRAALEAMDAPRTLVTTPTHLRALIESKVELPTLRHIVSATAPLPLELAQQVEQAWRAPVFEIYGCTEAGVVANRRTIEQKPWRVFAGGSVAVTDQATLYTAPQLPMPVPLQDMIESLSPTSFLLSGRAADMIKVAGKRTSLQSLTQAVLALDGVRDAAVFVPAADARPVALVVAPDCTAAQLLSALSERVDAVFLPRPFILVDTLPRNELGKLPQSALLRVLDEYRSVR